MKKFIVAIILTATLVCGIFAFGACTGEDAIEDNTTGSGSETTAKVSYSLVAPDGAPALALANVADSINTSKQYKITKSVVSATNISTEAIKSDIAIVPANLAANLYNGGNDIRLLAVVTNGNLFVLSTDDEAVDGLDGLVSNMVYSIGQGSVPDMIFQTLLREANIPYAQGERAVAGRVTIKYMTDGSEVMSQMALAKKAGRTVFGVFAEPAVTNAINKQGFKQVFDLQSLWAESTGSEYDGYAQAVLIAKASVCEDKEFVDKLIESFTASAEWIKENPAQAVKNIKAVYEQTSLSESITSDIIARCNINTVAMPEGKEYYKQMLDAVMAIKAPAIGGKLPDEAFYYAG